MEVNANLAQDVFKDAGESVIFVMLSLKREDIEKEREIIADMADRMEAIQRSMNIRVAPEKVTILTALLGAPFFAFLLKRTREKQGDWSRLR